MREVLYPYFYICPKEGAAASSFTPPIQQVLGSGVFCHQGVDEVDEVLEGVRDEVVELRPGSGVDGRVAGIVVAWDADSCK